MIAIVVPCYNEEHRFPVQEFQKYTGLYTFFFVNDGSTDGTFDLLKKNFGTTAEVLNLEKNQGKAEAVRQGMLKALHHRQKFEWVGFWDADLATPIWEVPNFLTFNASLYDGRAQVILGARIYRLGSLIKRKAIRHYFGRLFVTVCHALLGVQSYDSQCGAKLFRVAVIKNTFQEPFVSRWIFDVELILRLTAQKVRVVEYPLKQWIDIQGSKISILKESWRTFADLLMIRKKYLKK